MTNWTRRDILKMGVAAPVAARALMREPPARPLDSSGLATATEQTPAVSSRERLLLDFGWKFHLGNAVDPAADFDYGKDYAFAKSGRLFEPSKQNFDDSQWSAVDLPHDFGVDLPFVNEQSLIGRGAKPLSRYYPATSIGWYRRVFEVPAGDLGRRISVEFDGVYRDSIVALNGQYLGRNLSGYAPFRFDITDFVNYGGKNILVVRVDATESEGWFYEGAGIYRHAWLVKAAPVHVAQ